MKPLGYLLLGISLYLGGCAGPIEQWKRWRYLDYGLEDWHGLDESHGEEGVNATQPPPPHEHGNSNEQHSKKQFKEITFAKTWTWNALLFAKFVE